MNTGQWLGLVTGVFFGFLLQKGRVLRFDKQIGAMLLKDMTILKLMLSAILVGMVGILLLSNFEIITLSHKPMNVGALLAGGALFSAGWAIMGFCPGTSIGALGEGRWHAVFAIIGMVILAAFLSGAVIGRIGLPPLAGYLLTGFALNRFGVTGKELPESAADAGDSDFWKRVELSNACTG